MNLSLTVSDVQKFVDSRHDDAPIGITCDNSFCLVAEAFQWKYPEEEFWSVGSESITVWQDETGFIEVPITPDVNNIIERFDQLRDEGHTVTKRMMQKAKKP